MEIFRRFQNDFGYFSVRRNESHEIKKRLQISSQNGGTSGRSGISITEGADRYTCWSYFWHISRQSVWHRIVFGYVISVFVVFAVLILSFRGIGSSSIFTVALDMFSLFVESTTAEKCKKIRISDWPVKSPYHCYYCCHTFRTVPIPLVHSNFEFDKRICHICVEDVFPGDPFPVFCSVNCLIGYLENSNLNKVILIQNAFLLQKFLSQYFLFEEAECSLERKPKYFLRIFGKGNPSIVSTCHDGHKGCNIDEFRRGSCRFVDKRPPPRSIQSVQSGNSEKDLIIWPILYPRLISTPTTSSAVVAGTTLSTLTPISSVPLTSMDDPTEVFGINAVDHKTSQVENAESRTVSMISDLLQQTIDTKKLDEVSVQMRNMSLDSKSRSDVLPQTPKVTPKTTSQMRTPPKPPKRRKVKVNSPPTATYGRSAPAPPPSTTKTNASTGKTFTAAHHPLFGTRQ